MEKSKLREILRRGRETDAEEFEATQSPWEQRIECAKV